jgi:phosphatidylserine/phosphatidylglycerophosphate/cardiolipin synthase-like enzyme
MILIRILAAWIASLLLLGCVSPQVPGDQCPAGTQALPGCPPLEARDIPALNNWYELRTWRPASEWDRDPVEIGVEAEIPVQDARMKLLGGSDRDALYSLAAKIHMIEQAQHSVDAVYYILKDDLVGLAFLGALCEAVQRGVDIRLLVDSTGSISIDRNWLRALYQCQLEAGFIRDRDGQLSTRQARVQAVIFNPISAVFANLNRRSHDKLLVVDGFVPDRAMVMFGGRNMSLSYYGINADGSPNPDTYIDAELLLRPGDPADEGLNVAEISELYFSLVNGFANNKPVMGRVPPDRKSAYPAREQQMKASLQALKSLPVFAEAMAAMPEYVSTGYHHGQARLAHELGNLVSKRAISEAVANIERNPNSIMYLMAQSASDEEKLVRMVSPYLFVARYYGPDGELVVDEAREIKRWLAEDPERRFEMITNSVLTSDNFSAQSIVDIEMIPRVLLDEETVKVWQAEPALSEFNPELVDSIEWQELVNHPRIKVWETGRLDDRMLGGDIDYGKLHAKYMVSDLVGFLGTSNFDYRSRLFNNEMGFFFRSNELLQDFEKDFELLKSKSLRWGSPEWLEMRKRTAALGGIKGTTTRYQRNIYKFLRGTGLKWYF